MTTVTISDVLASDNLYTAWQRVLANQGTGGIDGISVHHFEHNVHSNLDTLRNEVIYATYRPSPLLRVYIDKKDGSKRPLSIPTVKDRILQTAVTQILNPIFEEEFEDVSFAYRQGRSVAQAINLVERLRNKGYHWVVDADIHKYFDEVDHNLLMQEIKKLITDTNILHLIEAWIKATIIDKKQRYTIDKGIPQGSPLSPLLANLYLDHLDETLLDNDFRLVRYADDFVVLCKSADKAKQALELTQDVLEGLRLALNQQKTQIIDFNQGFRFLGVRFVRSLALKSTQTRTHKNSTKAPLSTSTSTLEKKQKQRTLQKRKQQQKEEEKTNWYTYALSTGDEFTSSDEMREAFSEAGIHPQHFPSEATPDDNLPPPALTQNQKTNTNNQPRLKTLYLLEHDATLGKEYERFTIKKQGKIIKEIPAIHVDQIMVFGNAQLTTQVMHFCLQQRIPIYLLSGKGRYYGIVDSFNTDPVLLHREQFKQADNPTFSLQIACQFITGKLSNSRTLLKRQSRNRNAPAFDEANLQIKKIIPKLKTAKSLDQLRGYEGNAARIYFQAIAASLDPKWCFNGRNKQPPTDPVNALLSYGYTLLFYNIYSLLRTRGLNPHVGHLHPMRMGHPALVSPLRSRCLVI